MLGAGNSFAFTQSVPGQSGAARNPRQEEKQTVLPVTVRLVEDAVKRTAAEPESCSGGGLMIHGVEAGMLLIVGVAEAWSRQPMSIEFRLNDGTGRIKARHYLTDRQLGDMEKLGAGQYVSVFGNVRTAPELHFAVAGIRVVQSAAEVAYHTIEVAHAMIKVQNGPSQPKSPKMPESRVALLPMTSTVPAAAEFQTLAKVAEPQQQVSGTKVALQGDALRSAVLSFLKAEGEGRPEGVEFCALGAHFGGAAEAELQQVLELLVDAGDVFTTVDDMHYSCV
jgi:hypothetical protein